ncbi:MAG: hypothetical protein ABJ251_03645 [Paracoccaceae bacterium]
MSYDLLVFDPKSAPRDEDDFFEWLEEEDVDEPSDGEDGESPKGLPENLNAFYNLLRKTFPPMNGPHANHDDANSPMITDYYLGKYTIDMGFSWDVADIARRAVIEAAIETGVGFYSSSDDDGVAFDRNDLNKMER